MKSEVYIGDCLEIMKTFPESNIDFVYLDPPFFTGKTQELMTRDRTVRFSFSDAWKSADDYTTFLYNRLLEIKRILKDTGSIFFHCDRNASHIARFLLNNVFGENMFQSEIIWQYRRWSNEQKRLLPAHQNILFYTKSQNYKFNTIYLPYSPATNVDQILQKRVRDKHHKSIYAINENGDTIFNGHKKGVPLADVWDIPYLNPKAKERVGYPTQKPILLLERIIQLVTDKNDTILDPFCGSGTTLVAAEMLERNCIGIDISEDAVRITQERLKSPLKSNSHLMECGRDSYNNADKDAMTFLTGIDIVPVQRNKGIDAFLRDDSVCGSIPIRVQRQNETLPQAAEYLHKASITKHASLMILVATHEDMELFGDHISIPQMIVVNSTAKSIKDAIQQSILVHSTTSI
ncbi:MAG: site-specific DNA-methyltransferase [Dehalococcoidales bacterium]